MPKSTNPLRAHATRSNLDATAQVSTAHTCVTVAMTKSGTVTVLVTRDGETLDQTTYAAESPPLQTAMREAHEAAQAAQRAYVDARHAQAPNTVALLTAWRLASKAAVAAELAFHTGAEVSA